MQPLSFESITVDEISLPGAPEKNIRIDVLRLDKIHPVISGNKWFKLKYYLEEAKKQNKKHILTFGGAYSNHIVAVAAAGELYGFQTTGIIRGEKPPQPSHSLQQAIASGMELKFIRREDYRYKKIPEELLNNNPYIIHEGGYGFAGMKGASEILDHCYKEKYSCICCAVGTSTMMAGLIRAAAPRQEVIGISVLKGNMALDDELANLLISSDSSTSSAQKNFRLLHDYHCGGYAKHTKELLTFMNQLYTRTGVPTDFVYTGKLFYGISKMIAEGLIPEQSYLLLVHSGGLQGNYSLPGGTLIF